MLPWTAGLSVYILITSVSLRAPEGGATFSTAIPSSRDNVHAKCFISWNLYVATFLSLQTVSVDINIHKKKNKAQSAINENRNWTTHMSIPT